MRTYKRVRIAGGTYFFTVNLAQRRNTNLLIDHIGLLREALRSVVSGSSMSCNRNLSR